MEEEGICMEEEGILYGGRGDFRAERGFLGRSKRIPSPPFGGRG